jgi:lysophospholipase L1-like esterase
MPRPLPGLLAVAIVVALGGTGCAGPNSVSSSSALAEQSPLDPVPTEDDGDQLVVLFGDSLTELAVDHLRLRFAADPDRRLSAHWYGGTEVDTAAWVDLYPYVGEGSVVLLALGINDLFTGPVTAATDDVAAAVDDLTEAGAARVVMTTVNRNDVGTAPALTGDWADKVADYNEWLVAAGEDDVRFPTLEVARWDEDSVGHADWLQPDGVHHTPTGGAAYAELLFGAVVNG